MNIHTIKSLALRLIILSISCAAGASNASLERIKYNNPGLVVDLAVGLWAWPLPMDYDGDGDLDMVVSCPDKPYNGIYFFENNEGNTKMPVFEPPIRIGKGYSNICPNYINGKVRLLLPAKEIIDFCKPENQFQKSRTIYPAADIHSSKGRIRANQWQYCDYDGDGVLDLIAGIGYWTDYGWDNAFDKDGRWTRGPLHGYVYLLRNTGGNEKPQYEKAEKILAGNKPVDVYGMPSPNFADFDGDGDLDLICGQFVDKFTWFENKGTRKHPAYAAGRNLASMGKTLEMDLCMIVPVALDWDKDGDIDLVVGQEDGRVALLENTGKVIDNMPEFLPPRFFRQKADDVKFGALVTPYSFDWDNDGDEDLICGNSAGYVGLIENLDGANPPKWAAPVYLEADGKIIRIMAGPNGSIQGPCEAKWGYTTLNLADWDHDGLPDVIVNSIWGKVLWYRNIGTRQMPKFTKAQPVEVEWSNKPPKPAWNWWQPEYKNLATQWRTTPVIIDYNSDGLNDLIMLDQEGYLALFLRAKKDRVLILLPGKRLFNCKDVSAFDSIQQPKNKTGGLLQMNDGVAGKSGRRKFCFTDWDIDGRLDILANSRNINFLRNISTTQNTNLFCDQGMVNSRILAGHTTSPTVVDWDKNKIPDLLVGAEDGFLYYMKNPYNKTKQQHSLPSNKENKQ
ncbi:MAG: VCBS repeat-containing protein [Sedimentisphaerales bacterium]|nr:VCBS repeat-containing protein [Sedimentisphaerales bacterium]